MSDLDKIFTKEVLKEIFPSERTPQFFDALLGDDNEGAYDISLEYGGVKGNKLYLEFHLNQRPGRCLVCSLTYGLPQVFSRHPVIGVNEIVEKIDRLIGERGQRCSEWRLLSTKEVSSQLHIIPLEITLEDRKDMQE